jgi:hypothetical protein
MALDNAVRLEEGKKGDLSIRVVVNSLQGSAYMLGYAFYECCVQTQVEKGNIPYSWVHGHASDFLGSAAYTSYTQLFTYYLKTPFQRALVSTVVPTILSIHELFPLLGGQWTRDLQDIPCYYAGALLAYVVGEATHSSKVRTALNTAVSRVKKKQV